MFIQEIVRDFSQTEMRRLQEIQAKATNFNSYGQLNQREEKT